jgi:hypothetical protein
VKIERVRANNRKKAFEIETTEGSYSFPYARLSVQPSRADRVREVFPDQETGAEAFTYRLESGVEDTIHLDAVLEYNQDPALLNELLLHRLTLRVREAVAESGLSKREMIRRLGTSPSQFYRLLDPAYYGKSTGQLLALLRILGYRAEIVVWPEEGSHRHLASPSGLPHNESG